MTMDNDMVDDLEILPERSRVDIPKADQSLLERAARAIGAVRVEVVDGAGYVNLYFANGVVVHSWNPLKFSVDALDLAIRLRLEIYIREQDTSAMATDLQLANEHHGDDAGAATRRAITRVASKTCN